MLIRIENFINNWIGLCVSSAVLKKYHDEGENKEDRKKLTRWCYIPTNKNEAIRILLDAYEQMPFVDDIEKRIRTAHFRKPLLEDYEQWLLDRLEKAKLFTAEEREKYVLLARELIEKAIAVDDFKAEEY